MLRDVASYFSQLKVILMLFLSIHFHSSLRRKTKYVSNPIVQLVVFGFTKVIVGAIISGSHSGTFENLKVALLLSDIFVHFFVIAYDQEVIQNELDVTFSALLKSIWIRFH
jgi:hypothetical protein